MQEIKLPFTAKVPVLAVGAQSKNTLCFIKGDRACLSPVHPDLTEPAGLSAFKSDLKFFLKKKPQIISCDMHQGYQSTAWARDLSSGYKVLEVQHHHSHIASCMAESGMKNKRVIGVAFDGTGLGDDRSIWGGEFLVCDYRGYVRAAHLAEIALLGASQAIREPWRLAAAWLFKLYKDRFLKLDNAFVRRINKKDWRILRKMQAARFNTPLTSSMGRLFDAAASLILAKYRSGSEGELAIELQRLASGCQQRGRPLNFKIARHVGGYVVYPYALFKEILVSLRDKESKQSLALRFHLGVAKMIKDTAVLLRKNHGINNVVLSGGVFQNRLLLKESIGLLYKEGFGVFMHNKLSCNDSGISLGQAAIASFRRR